MDQIKNLIRGGLAQLGYRITGMPDAVPLADYHELFPAASIERRAFYNFGAGNWRHPYWSNVDYSSEHYRYAADLIDVEWDIAALHSAPIESESAELVYSSHTIEHLLDEHVAHMLREALRVLKPGGVCRITTPNIELLYEAYRNDDVHFGRHYGADKPRPRDDLAWYVINEAASQLVQDFNGHRAPLRGTANMRAALDGVPMAEALGRLSKQINFNLQREVTGHHVSWWTNEKLSAAMLRAGFSRAIVSVAGGSVASVMRDRRYFDVVNPTCSIFVDAVK